MNEPKPKYTFHVEVTDPKTNNTVRVQWDNLTLTECRTRMHRLGEKGSIYFAQIERFGWKEMT